MQRIQYVDQVIIETLNSPIDLLTNTPSLGQTGDGGIFVTKIRESTVQNDVINLMHYDISNNEVVYNTSKTFVINHPTDSNRYLVHACLEGPESGVYYRGRGEITNHRSCTIHLPPYVANLATNFTVHLTPIADPTTFRPTLGSTRVYYTTEVHDNQFDVFGENGQFFWIVHGQRQEIQVEIEKTQVKLQGNGPYQWISDLHNN